MRYSHALAAIAAVCLNALATPAQAQITFYQDEGFRGRAFTATKPVNNFGSVGFNDRASSVVVEGGRWEVCENSNYGGECVVLRPGSYSSLGAMGLNDQLSSTRPANARRTAVPDGPAPLMKSPDYVYRQRPGEAVFQAPVTSVRAVVGPPTERCWVERQQVEQRNEVSPGRTLLGAVIGGVIGHQIGGGVGKDLATAGGAIAGGVIGARSGRDNEAGPAQDVRRCSTTASTVPEYWDVSYDFRGVQHRVQMRNEPGNTISVNAKGEPRQ